MGGDLVWRETDKAHKAIGIGTYARKAWRPMGCTDHILSKSLLILRSINLS